MVMLTLYDRIIALLNENNIHYTEHRHEPVRTSEEAAAVRGSNIEEGAKALIFMADEKPIQIILQGHLRVDKEKVKSLLGITKLKMAAPEQVITISGVEPGGVPPFGNVFLKPIPVYVDENLLELEEIEFNAGDKSISIRMKVADWAKVVGPIKSQLVNIT